jgi:hypothetical protein
MEGRIQKYGMRIRSWKRCSVVKLSLHSPNGGFVILVRSGDQQISSLSRRIGSAA